MNLSGEDSEQLNRAFGLAPAALQKLLSSGNLSQLKQTAQRMMSNKDTQRRVKRVMKKIGGKKLTKTVLDLAQKNAETKVPEPEPENATENKDASQPKKKKKKNKKKALASFASSLLSGDTDTAKILSTSLLDNMKKMDKETFETLKDLGSEAMEANPEMIDAVASIAADILPADAVQPEATQQQQEKKKKKKNKKKKKETTQENITIQDGSDTVVNN